MQIGSSLCHSRTMKATNPKHGLRAFRILRPAALVFVILAIGCSNVNQLRLDSTKRAPTKTVDVFKGGNLPAKPGKRIAELSCQSYPHRELGVIKNFVTQAGKLGGHAIIVTAEQTGFSTDLFGTAQRVLYKADVIVYE